MKNLPNKLTLNKRTIQILDDKSLVDIRGGIGASDATCDYRSCKVVSCAANSCNEAAAGIQG